MSHETHSPDSSAQSPAPPVLPAITIPGHDEALEAALDTLQQRLDVFVEAVGFHQRRLDDRQAALDAQEASLEHKSAQLDQRDEHLEQSGAELDESLAARSQTDRAREDELGQREAQMQRWYDEFEQARAQLEQAEQELAEQQTQLAADQAALEAERDRLEEQRASATEQPAAEEADQHPESHQATPEPEATAIEQSPPDRGNSEQTPEDTRGPDDIGQPEVVATEQTETPGESASEDRLLGRLGQSDDESAEAGPGDQPVAPTEADPPPEPLASETSVQPGLETAPQPQEAETSQPAESDLDSMDVDPQTLRKLKVLRRLAGPDKSDAELLAQLESRQETQQPTDKHRKRWWQVGH